LKLGISEESRLNTNQMKMKTLKKGERGFTLLELLIAIALTAIITTVVNMAIFQTITGSTRSSNHMVAVRKVQEAGYWVSFYTYAAQNLIITGDSGFPLKLSWVDFDTAETHEVVFSLNASGLRRSYSVDGVFDPVKTGKIPALDFINPDKTKTNCQVSSGSGFSLDNGDAFEITGGATNDTGKIIVTSGGISVTTTGSGATYDSGTGVWTTITAGDTIKVTATNSNTKGSWTSETKAAAAAITVDSGAPSATLSYGNGLIFTVTATVGSGNLESSETRIYKIVPKPVS
jgi:prepilin-type N-terminal cleavage/methylation domain-containing protein